MSDSAFLELEKGTAAPSAGATDFDRFYIDPSDNKFTRKKSNGSTDKFIAEGSYSASDIINVPSGNISATDVQAALNEIDSEKLAASHAGTGGSAHAQATTLVDGFLSAADKTKLDGIASGATVNSSDATLLNRANHTGTQLKSTISDLVDATTIEHGLMSTIDKTKLDAIELQYLAYQCNTISSDITIADDYTYLRVDGTYLSDGYTITILGTGSLSLI